jgi:arginyl-tRNA synthetase
MNAENILREKVLLALTELYGANFNASQVAFQKTKPEFTGDFTLVTFPFVKTSGKSPEQTGEEIGKWLQEHADVISNFNVIKGFLNLSLSDKFWLSFFSSSLQQKNFGIKEVGADAKSIMIEYPSPNTNKPLHLGHLRNIFLGSSVSELLKAGGNHVIHSCLYNDRGTNICKSMLAWKKWGNGATPQKEGKKGDHLVGHFYVLFDIELKKQLKPMLASVYEQQDFSLFSDEEKEKLSALIPKRKMLLDVLSKDSASFSPSDISTFETALVELAESAKDGKKKFKDLGKELEKFEKPNAAQKEVLKKIKALSGTEGKIEEIEDAVKEIAQRKTPIMQEVHKMLEAWEAGDKETVALWEMMNDWVYKGFDATYKTLGIKPEKFYYESDVYKLGKETVAEGLEKAVFYKKEDGSVWIDLTADGLDHKVVLRSNGTSVYITQDIAVANEKEREYRIDKSIYVVGNEQDYHFKVLFLILKKLGRSYADNLFHLSYGMVELPSGKMKSREGTVVDADDLVAEVIEKAEQITREQGKIEHLKEEEKQQLFSTLGLGALKYFILKVDPKKKMLFNPEESVDLHGNTGPFIQYSHARIRSMITNSGVSESEFAKEFTTDIVMNKEEKELIRLFHEFPIIVQEAGQSYSPALVANFAYETARHFNQFYHEHPVLKAPDEKTRDFRLRLSWKTGLIIKSAMKLLGIEVPERM